MTFLAELKPANSIFVLIMHFLTNATLHCTNNIKISFFYNNEYNGYFLKA